jgi:hypothetical protein
MNDHVEVYLVSKILSHSLAEISLSIAYASHVLHTSVLEFRTHYQVKFLKGVLHFKKALIVANGISCYSTDLVHR